MNDNHVFAGGYLKSTLDPEAAGFVESPTDYAVSGPYTTSDWNGTNAQTITVDLKSHPTLKMLAARGARARRASWRSTRRLRAHRTGYVLRSRTSPTMLGRSLLDVGPLVSPKTVWMPIRQSTVMRPGLRLTTSQKKEEPSRVFPKPRHHAIRVLVPTWCRRGVAMAAARANTTREVLESPVTMSWKTTGLHRMNLKGMIP